MRIKSMRSTRYAYRDELPHFQVKLVMKLLRNIRNYLS